MPAGWGAGALWPWATEVSKAPGTMWLTRMPCGASSTERARVSPRAPIFPAQTWAPFGASDEGVEAGYVDDSAPAAFYHAGDEGLAGEEGGVHVDGVDGAPVFDGHLGEGGRGAHSGVVDEDVHAAEFGDGGLCHAVHLGLVGDVGYGGYGSDAEGAGFVGDGVGFVAVGAGVDCDVGALAGEFEGGGAAYVAAGAGD